MNKKVKLFVKRKLPILIAFPLISIPAGYSLTSSISHNKIEVVNTNSLNTINDPFNPIDKSNLLVFDSANESSEINPSFVSYSSEETFHTLNSNDLNLTQALSLFEKQVDYSTIKGEGKYINYDLKNYAINLLRKQLNNFVISDFALTDLSVESQPVKQIDSKSSNIIHHSLETQNIETSEVKFDNKISFNFKVSFAIKKPQTVEIANRSFVLKNNVVYTLALQALNQPIKPIINSFAGNNYLGWILDEVTYKLDNEIWTQNINVTKDYYSNVFKTQIQGVENKLSYFDLVNKTQSKLDSYLETKFKDQLEARFNNEFAKEFGLISDVNKVLYDLLTNKEQPVIEIIKSNFQVILSFLAKSNIVHGFFVETLVNVFNLNTKQGLNDLINKPFYDLVRTHKNALLKTLGVNSNSVINTLLSSYDELFNGITDDFDLRFILNPIWDFVKRDRTLYYSIEPIVKKELFGISGGKQKSLFNLVFDNLTVIKNIVNKVVNNNVAKSFLNLLIPDKDKKGINFYEMLFEANGNKKTDVINLFLEIFKKNEDSKIQGIIKAVFSDNKAFSRDNFITVFTNLAKFTNGFFEKDAETENKDFYESFTNLTFEKKWNSFTYNKSNKTLTYDYEIRFKLKKSVDFTLFEDLKKLVNLDSLIATVNAAIDKSPLKGKESIVKLTNIEDLVKKILPGKITFGIDETQLKTDDDKQKAKTSSYSVFFKSNEKQVWLVPLIDKKTNKYKFGFNFAIEKGFKFEDYNAIESLTKQYEKKDIQEFDLTAGIGWFLTVSAAKVKISFKPFIESLIQELLLKPFSTYKRVDSFIEDEYIVETNEFDVSSYSGIKFSGISVDKKSENSIKDLLKKYKTTQGEVDNFFNKLEPVKQINKTFSWKGRSDNTSNIVGLNPKISKELEQKLDELVKSKLDEIFKGLKDKNITNYSYDLNYTIKHQASAKLSLELQFNSSGLVASFLGELKGKKESANLGIDLSSISIQVYLPFKVFDESTKQLTNSYTFNISENKVAKL